MLKKKNFVVLIRGISIVFILILGSCLISQTYLDVGDDPEKIEVVEVKQITTDGGYNPESWSPNGAYVAVYKRGHTFLFDADGRMVKKIDRACWKWSHDSKKILCSGMWLVDVKSGEEKKVITEKGYSSTFLPSGDRIIYHSKDGLSIVDIKILNNRVNLYDHKV